MSQIGIVGWLAVIAWCVGLCWLLRHAIMNRRRRLAAEFERILRELNTPDE